MKYRKGNILGVALYDAICLPTSGTLRSSGDGVLEPGIGHEAMALWGPGLEARLGKHIAENTNTPGCIHTVFSRTLFGEKSTAVWSFPYRHHWTQSVDADLIKNSALWLIHHADQLGWKKVAIPEIGGRLWGNVKPILDDVLDDRFVALHPPQ